MIYLERLLGDQFRIIPRPITDLHEHNHQYPAVIVAVVFFPPPQMMATLFITFTCCMYVTSISRTRDHVTTAAMRMYVRMLQAVVRDCGLCSCCHSLTNDHCHPPPTAPAPTPHCHPPPTAPAPVPTSCCSSYSSSHNHCSGVQVGKSRSGGITGNLICLRNPPELPYQSEV